MQIGKQLLFYSILWRRWWNTHLKDRLAAYKLNSSPHQLEVMEVEVPQTQKETTKPQECGWKEDFSEYIRRWSRLWQRWLQFVIHLLFTDVLNPAGNYVWSLLKNAGVSPEKKVRKMRASSFNQKSSSLMARVAATDSKDDSVSPVSSLNTSDGGGSG